MERTRRIFHTAGISVYVIAITAAVGVLFYSFYLGGQYRSGKLQLEYGVYVADLMCSAILIPFVLYCSELFFGLRYSLFSVCQERYKTVFKRILMILSATALAIGLLTAIVWLFSIPAALRLLGLYILPAFLCVAVRIVYAVFAVREKMLYG